MLAHLGWNITLDHQISLIRGAAKLQNRDWGIIITWKYNQPPYLDTGSEIFNQMQTAYECGAKYLVLFNYYLDDGNPHGTMQEEHFQALENFWNNTYKEVKKELRGKYKKHYWPDDPLTAIATSKTKKHM